MKGNDNHTITTSIPNSCIVTNHFVSCTCTRSGTHISPHQ